VVVKGISSGTPLHELSVACARGNGILYRAGSEDTGAVPCEGRGVPVGHMCPLPNLFDVSRDDGCALAY
jgi:hypothetical protein